MFTILLVRDSQLQGYIRQEDEELKMLIEKFHDEIQEPKNHLGDQIKENRDEIKESKDHLCDQIKENRDEIKDSKDQVIKNRDQFEHELKELKRSINSIYFDKTPSTYADAKIRCTGTFNHTGRMYEPRTMEESINVYLVALGSFTFNDWWIGVNDIKEEGKFVFDTNGSPITFNTLWSKGHGSKGKN